MSELVRFERQEVFPSKGGTLTAEQTSAVIEEAVARVKERFREIRLGKKTIPPKPVRSEWPEAVRQEARELERVIEELAPLARRVSERGDQSWEKKTAEEKEAQKDLDFTEVFWQHALVEYIGRYRRAPFLSQELKKIWHCAYTQFREFFEAGKGGVATVRNIHRGVLGMVTAASLLESAGVNVYLPDYEEDMDNKVDLFGARRQDLANSPQLFFQVKASTETKEPRLILATEKKAEVKEALEQKSKPQAHDELMRTLNAINAITGAARNFQVESQKSCLALWFEVPAFERLEHTLRGPQFNLQEDIMDVMSGLPNPGFIDKWQKSLVYSLDVAEREKQRSDIAKIRSQRYG